MWSFRRSEKSLPLAAKRGSCCHFMVDAFLLSEMIFMPVPFQLLKCDDDETAQQALVRQVTPNEILLPVDRNSAGVLILREFKTQDRKHPVLYTRSLGSELTKLRASLKKEPRPYLFTESNSTRPYTHSAFAMYARRTLQKLFGKPCTLTLLRHSYISHMLAYGQLTIRDREQLAAEMCHSPAT